MAKKRGGDWSTVEYNLNGLYNQLEQMRLEVNENQQKIQLLANRVSDLLKKEERAKNVRMAETRLIKIRQETKLKFAYYGEVRKRAAGLLQGFETGMLKTDAIAGDMEELMTAAPRYWLAPCYVALAAWLSNNQSLAQKALGEAIQCNQEKTALFFALVCRRVGRYEASQIWLECYLSGQNPRAVQGELAILLDGYASGYFGVDSQGQWLSTMESWVRELSGLAGNSEIQQCRWEKALLSIASPLAEDAYSQLREYSPTWDKLEVALIGAKWHEEITRYFKKLADEPRKGAPSLYQALDILLDDLVSEVAEEEVPLRQNERLNRLIVEEEGDREIAQKRFSQELEGKDEKVNFVQLLVNLSMNPENSGASKVAQDFAIAMSKDWIQRAYQSVTEKNRALVPASILIQLDEWQGITENGENEEALIRSFELYQQVKLRNRLARARLKPRDWLTALLGGATLGYGLYGGVNLALWMGVGLSAWFGFGVWRIVNLRKHVRVEQAKRVKGLKQTLRSIVAEVAGWRREYHFEDGQADKFLEYLQEITLEPKNRKGETVRSLLAKQFPDWDLMPPIVMLNRLVGAKQCSR